MALINLADLTRNGEVRNLTGHERGNEARRHYNLDALDVGNEEVVIKVPSEVYAISPSFFQGMLTESIVRLGGREAFLKRYRFDASPIILQQVERAIVNSQTRRGHLMSA